MDRLKPHSTEGKILLDIEDIFGLHCMIEDATRITKTTRTLLDLILTNNPDSFEKAGTVDFGLPE